MTPKDLRPLSKAGVPESPHHLERLAIGSDRCESVRRSRPVSSKRSLPTFSERV